MLGIDVGYKLNNALTPQREPRGGYSYSERLDETPVSVSCVPLTAKGAPAKADLGLINTQNFYYSDYSHSGIARVDGSVVYLPFEQTQLLCGMAGPVKRASAIHIKFKPNVKLQEGCEKVSSLWQNFKQEKAGEEQAYLLDTVTVQSWKEYRRSFIAPMEKEQAEVIVMFALVGITTVFIVLVVFYMIISHKTQRHRHPEKCRCLEHRHYRVIFWFCVFSRSFRDLHRPIGRLAIFAEDKSDRKLAF